jgi:hypothetical protein
MQDVYYGVKKLGGKFMINKEFKEWKNSAERLLEDCWRFRKLCKKPFDRGFIGGTTGLKTAFGHI